MPKDYESPFSETGKYNIAMGYANEILFHHVLMMNRSEILAEYGSLDPLDSIYNDEYSRDVMKIEGLKFFKIYLEMLISYAHFAVKKKENRGPLEDCHKKIKELTKYMDVIEKIKTDQVRKINTKSINKDVFNKVFNILKDIRMEVMPILYREDLIFKYVEELSPKEFKKAMMRRMVEYG